mgnify:FL=1
MNLNEKQTQWIEKAARHSYTLNETHFENGDSMELTECIPDKNTKMPEDELIEFHDKEKLRRLLETIECREAKVLKMRYGFDNTEPMTLREVSKKLNISREWVRKIEKKGLSKLNQLMSCN